MKIVICASMSAATRVIEVARELTGKGCKIELPRNIEKYASGKALQSSSESIEAKVQNDLIRDYFNRIAASDAILVINCDKGGIRNYVGGNSFLEMGYAYALKKKIFLYNPIPRMIYTDEIITMDPIVISGDLNKIS